VIFAIEGSSGANHLAILPIPIRAGEESHKHKRCPRIWRYFVTLNENNSENYGVKWHCALACPGLSKARVC